MINEEFLKRLQPPTGLVDVILDTDAYNEIDDQYAIAYLLLSSDRLRTVGICAAPFFTDSNPKSDSAADGMEKSYAEIHKILNLMSKNVPIPPVYRGSARFLPDEMHPVCSDAAKRIVEEAERHSVENPLYILAIGAITNVASAILMNRSVMVENTVVVFLGGNALGWPDNREFNLMQDVAAARVVFSSGVPVVQLPCMGVVSEFRTTSPELRQWIYGRNPLGDYLVENTEREANGYAEGKPWSRVIWDVTAVGWLLDERFMSDYLTPTPIPQYDNHYSFDSRRQLMRYVYHINRDALFEDLFAKLTM